MGLFIQVWWNQIALSRLLGIFLSTSIPRCPTAAGQPAFWLLPGVIYIFQDINSAAMADNLHGLCKTCLPFCRQILLVSRNQDECARCMDVEPTLIIQEEGQVTAICTKCYLKEARSPGKSEVNKIKGSLITDKGNKKNVFSSITPNIPGISLLNKSDLLSKGFFSSQGKMVRRIDKYLMKFESTETLFKELSKKTIVHVPIIWQKLIPKIDKVGGLLYIFVTKSHLFGLYHLEGCRVSERGFEDAQSGFFMSLRSKLDPQYYKASNDSMVIYNPNAKSVSIGKTSNFEIMFRGQADVKCELVPPFSEWLYQFVIKV